MFQEKKKSGQFGLKLKTIAQDLLGMAIVLQYSALFRLSISSFGPAFLKACFVQESAFNKTNNTVLAYCFVKTFSFPFSKSEVGSHVAQAGLILPELLPSGGLLPSLCLALMAFTEIPGTEAMLSS